MSPSQFCSHKNVIAFTLMTPHTHTFCISVWPLFYPFQWMFQITLQFHLKLLVIDCDFKAWSSVQFIFNFKLLKHKTLSTMLKKLGCHKLKSLTFCRILSTSLFSSACCTFAKCIQYYNYIHYMSYVPMENMQQTISEMIRQFSSSKKTFESKLEFFKM